MRFVVLALLAFILAFWMALEAGVPLLELDWGWQLEWRRMNSCRSWWSWRFDELTNGSNRFWKPEELRVRRRSHQLQVLS